MLKILVWFLAGAKDIFCSPKYPPSLQLVPGAVSRGTAASAMKLTTHLPLMSRLRMNGVMGLHGMHRDSVMCILHSLFCQGNVVAVFRVLLLKSCNFFFISFCYTYVAIQSWSETVLLIIRWFKLFKLCCKYVGCVLVCRNFL